MPKLVISTIVIQNNQLLVVQEGKPSNHGKWNIPSGRIEDSEKVIDAAVREVFEETGYQVRLTGFSGIYRFFSESGNLITRLNFVGEISGGELKCDGKEILAVKWIDLDEFSKIDNSELWNGESIKQILTDVQQKRSYPLEVVKELF